MEHLSKHWKLIVYMTIQRALYIFRSVCNNNMNCSNKSYINEIEIKLRTAISEIHWPRDLFNFEIALWNSPSSCLLLYRSQNSFSKPFEAMEKKRWTKKLRKVVFRFIRELYPILPAFQLGWDTLNTVTTLIKLKRILGRTIAEGRCQFLELRVPNYFHGRKRQFSSSIAQATFLQSLSLRKCLQVVSEA